MGLEGWTYLFEFGSGLFIYSRRKQRIGVDKNGQLLIAFSANTKILPHMAGKAYQKTKIRASKGLSI